MAGGPARASFRSSAIMNYATTVGASVLSLGNVLVIARTLNATGRGQIAFLTTVAIITASLAALGFAPATATFAGRRPELTGSLATNAVLASVVTGAAAIAIVTGLVAIFPGMGGDVPHGLLWASLATVPVIIAGMSLQAALIAHYGFRAVNVASITTPVLTVAANGVMAAVGVLTVGLALAAWITGQVIATGIQAWYVWRRLGGFKHPDATLGREVLAFGVRAHAGRVLNQGNYRLDQWLMGSLAGSHALGIYSVAVAWTEGLFFLPTSLALTQVPDVTRATPEDAARQAAMVFRVATLITAVLGIGMVILAPFLATTVFGSQFAPATEQIRVLTFGAFGIVALKLLGSTLTAQRRPMLETAATACAFVVVVGLDVLLIPAHEGLGASVASLAGYSAGGVCVAALFSRTLGVRLRELVPRPREITALSG
jgi:O-antigen/teichoic acid export membrane protein